MSVQAFAIQVLAIAAPTNPYGETSMQSLAPMILALTLAVAGLAAAVSPLAVPVAVAALR